jgi:hypothetical protein
MDEEMNFPNPVVRNDLPTRRRKLPRVLLGSLVLGLLALVFLPQILSSKVGRKFVVSYLTAKTNSVVTLESFKTSWFGGTTVRFLSIADPMNRRMGFKSLTCQASLWNLLRGKYKLGETVIEGLNLDYVVNDGRGSDSFDRMKDPPPEGASAPPASGGWLPNLSGKITINSGTITLIRGTVQPKLYNVTWEQGRLANVEATFDIASLDKPWTYTFSADTLEGDAERGSISSSGTVDLGENGQADAKQLKLDLTMTGEKVRTGTLGAALIPAATPQDARQALGDVLEKIDVAVRASDGMVTFVRCDASGPGAQVHLKPTIDLAATPAVLGIGGSEAGTISLGVSKGLAADWLVYLNPFFREAMGGRGNVTLTVEQLRLPIDKQWMTTTTARGRISAKEVMLERKDEMSGEQTLPDNLASQLALLTGDSAKEAALAIEGKFSVAGGSVMVSPMLTTIADSSLMLEGSTELASGNVKLLASVVKVPAITSLLQDSRPGIGIPIGGTIRQPQLGVFGLKGELAEASVKSLNEGINTQITRMRAKETQRLMQKSENQVKEILRPLQGPATAPTSK